MRLGPEFAVVHVARRPSGAWARRCPCSRRGPGSFRRSATMRRPRPASREGRSSRASSCCRSASCPRSRPSTTCPLGAAPAAAAGVLDVRSGVLRLLRRSGGAGEGRDLGHVPGEADVQVADHLLADPPRGITSPNLRSRNWGSTAYAAGRARLIRGRPALAGAEERPRARAPRSRGRGEGKGPWFSRKGVRVFMVGSVVLKSGRLRIRRRRSGWERRPASASILCRPGSSSAARRGSTRPPSGSGAGRYSSPDDLVDEAEVALPASSGSGEERARWKVKFGCADASPLK
jgi:hypothetical protein